MLESPPRRSILFPAFSSPTPAPIRPCPPPDHPATPRYPPGSRYPVGLNAEFYLSSNDGGGSGVWDTAPKGCTATWCAKSNINWGPIDRAIGLTAANTVTLQSGSVISAPVVMNLPPLMMDRESDGACGSASDPCIRLFLPTWMEEYHRTFQNTEGNSIDAQGAEQVSNWWYNTVDYGSPVFRARMKQFLTEAAARYNDDPRVTGIRVVTGFQGETQPVKKDKLDVGSEQALIASHEDLIPCDQYRSYVRDITEHAYRVFTKKPIYLMAGPAPCAADSGQKWRYELLYDPVAGWEVVSPKKMIGFSMNRDDADSADADERAGNLYADYRWWSIGPTMFRLGRPLVWESGSLPSNSNAQDDPWAYQVWRFYGVAGAKGDSVFNASSWQAYMSQLSWDVLDNWMGRQPQRLWLVFRNAEWPTYNYTADRGASGYLGVWGNWLDLLDTDTYEQACNHNLYTAAHTGTAALRATRANTIYREPCDSLLPMPAVTPRPTAEDGADMLNRTFNRQSLVLSSTGPESEMDITLVDGHPATGQVKDLAVTVSYLDRGTDRFFLTFPLASGATRQYAIAKTGTNLWRRAAFVVPNAMLDNRLTGVHGAAFIVISNDNDPQKEFLHEVYADISEPAATPTPTKTITSTPTRTATPSTTPTQTPSVTLSPTATVTTARTATPSPPPTQTPTVTLSPTTTVTTARTATPSATPTQTARPSAPPTITVTHTPTRTPTATIPALGLFCLPRVETAMPIGGRPKGVAGNENGFYVGLYTNNQLVRTVPGETAIAWVAPTGAGGANGVAVWDNVALTTNRDRGAITLHDATSGAQLASLAVGGLPWGVAAAQGRAYVANFGDGTVSIIDLPGRRVLKTVPAGSYPVAAVAETDGVYVVHLNGNITHLDSQGEILAQARVDAPDVRGIAWDGLRNRVYVGSREGLIIAADDRTLQPIVRIELPGPAYSMVVNPATGRLYAVDALNDRLYVLDPDSWRIAQIALPAQNAADGGMGIAAWDNHIVVANYDAGSLTFVDDTTCAERLTPTPTPAALTATPKADATATITTSPTATERPSATPTASATPSPTASATPIATSTATASATATMTQRPSATPTATATPSPTVSAAPTATPTATASATATMTQRPSATPTATATPSPTVSAAPTATPTATASATATMTQRPSATPTATATPTASPTATLTRTPTRTLIPTATSRPTPAVIQTKIEIVWPHNGASVRDADLANITAYLISAPNGTNPSLLEPPPCDWEPTVRLWSALNAEPARPVAVGQKRMAIVNGHTFPVWDFNDVDVSAARDPANRLTFFTTVDGVRTLHNIWTHATDARTVFPQADVPTGTISHLPAALDARIEIVWPHDGLQAEQATLANITTYLFAPGTLQAIPPGVSWTPTARLHWSLNADAEKSPGTGILGTPRAITSSNGVKFLAWDFNDVDISAAHETLNKLYFWVNVDDAVTFPNVWAHGTEARTVFPQPDVLNNCR